MSLEFTKLSEVTTAESTGGTAKLLVEDGGEVKRLASIAQEQLPAGYPWDGRTVIEWDGNTEGHEVVEDVFVHISDMVPEPSETLGGKIVVHDPEKGDVEIPIDFGGAVEGLLGMYVYGSSMIGTQFLYAVYTAGAEFDGAVFEKTGLYVFSEVFRGVEISIPYGKATPISETLLPESVKPWSKVETVIAEMQTVEVVEGDAGCAGSFVISEAVSEGDIIAVTCNGTKREHVVEFIQGMLVVGDVMTCDPYALMFQENQAMLGVSAPGNVEIEIAKVTAVTKTIAFPTKAFVVKLSEDNTSVDKSFEEIHQAYAEGRNIVLRKTISANEGAYALYALSNVIYTAGAGIFNFTAIQGGNEISYVSIGSSGSVSVDTVKFATAT